MLRRMLVVGLLASLCVIGIAGSASAQSYPPEEPPTTIDEPEVGSVVETPDEGTASVGSGLLPRTGMEWFHASLRLALILFVTAGILLTVSRRREHTIRA